VLSRFDSFSFLLNVFYAVYPVEEEEDSKIPGENGEHITVPVNMVHANPNGVEFDNLYLDMNGIVGFSSIITFQSISCPSYRFTPARTLRARSVHNISLAKICYLYFLNVACSRDRGRNDD
jgi:hypothetical protein